MNNTSPLTKSEFQKLAGISDPAIKTLVIYLELLEKWQRKINLVSKSTLEDPWRRHIFDSAQLFPLIPAGTEILADIGSGAGFPALVLAILSKHSENSETKPLIHLIESDQRKCAFLSEVNRQTGAGVTIHNERIEKVQDLQVDVVTARACAALPKLLELAFPLLGPQGKCLFLKGETAPEELTESQKSWMMQVEEIKSKTHISGKILLLKGISKKTGI